mgnify:CR=1 FL=1
MASTGRSGSHAGGRHITTRPEETPCKLLCLTALLAVPAWRFDDYAGPHRSRSSTWHVGGTKRVRQSPKPPLTWGFTRMAWLRYTLLRVLLFLVVAALLWIVGIRGVWLVMFH